MKRFGHAERDLGAFARTRRDEVTVVTTRLGIRPKLAAGYTAPAVVKIDVESLEGEVLDSDSTAASVYRFAVKWVDKSHVMAQR